MKPSDLRGILGYTTRFRDQTFVLAVDSAVLAGDQAGALLTDLSVLRSLNIRLVLGFGISRFLRDLAGRLGLSISDDQGMGVTDADTLATAVLAAGQVGNRLLEGLSASDLPAAVTNALVAHPAGILSGTDHEWTGRVERVDHGLLADLLGRGVIPLLPPVAYDGAGRTYRVNSDQAALAVATALKAAKLIYITTSRGVRGAGTLSGQFSVEEATAYLARHRSELAPDLVSKLDHGLRACRGGVARAHIINGLEPNALLDEIFSNEGVGTMIYANEYMAIRKARPRDLPALQRLIGESAELEQILPRGREDLAARMADFFVYEIDRNLVGCVGLRRYPDEADGVAELECLVVASAHENQGIGRRLMQFVENAAREQGHKSLLALSTQAFAFFLQKGGFREGTVSDLPPSRREAYEASQRRSRILVRDLG